MLSSNILDEDLLSFVIAHMPWVSWVPIKFGANLKNVKGGENGASPRGPPVTV